MKSHLKDKATLVHCPRPFHHRFSDSSRLCTLCTLLYVGQLYPCSIKSKGMVSWDSRDGDDLHIADAYGETFAVVEGRCTKLSQIRGIQ